MACLTNGERDRLSQPWCPSCEFAFKFKELFQVLSLMYTNLLIA